MTDRIEFPQSRCLAGVARADITPPVGIYHRMWGAATHDRSEGVHQPLTLTALVLAPAGSEKIEDDAVALVGIDHCLLWTQDMRELLERVATQSGLAQERITVFFSHTHAAGLMGRERVDLPGGELILDYLAWLAEQAAASITMAVRRARAATIVYGSGHCDLATNRDYFDAGSDHYVCGFNPDGAADTTVVVARVSEDDSKQTLATVVNYACHPTTLAWDNTLISPDYVGSTRDVIEEQTGAPCLFIQGASGDVGPREGYVGDVRVAERNGRRLGHAAAAVLEGLPPAATEFRYTGPVVSGATIGTWDYVSIDAAREQQIARWESATSMVELPYRADRLDADELRRQRDQWEAEEAAAQSAGDVEKARDARAMAERMTRRLVRTADLPEGESYPYPLRIQRIGDAFWLAFDGEHYNLLQREIRKRLPNVPIVLGTLANGSNVWYLPDRASYGKGLYQEDASVLAQGALETLIDAAISQIERMTEAS